VSRGASEGPSIRPLIPPWSVNPSVTPINRVARYFPITTRPADPVAEPQEEGPPMTDTISAVEATATEAPTAGPSRFREIRTQPMPMARMTGTFAQPGGNRSDSVTVQVLVFATDIFNDLEGSDPVGGPEHCPELKEAGWHGSSVQDLAVFIRVIPGF
jgi:hypothetical protein